MNIGFISLGCSKNRVDTEIMMAIVKKAGHKLVDSAERADAVIINTCGFITEAKEEAIEAIIETGRLKEKGILKYLIATGCLSQRYDRELLDEMPELDAVVGISSFNAIDEVLQKVMQGEKVSLCGPPPSVYIEKGPRILTTPSGWAYLKIVEGCNNRCSYCTIPSIRGNLRSKPLAEIISEARGLVTKGVKELILIGQDTTVYGNDLGAGYDLSCLLHELGEIEGLAWIRLMYLHPAHIKDSLAETIASEEKVVPYLDIPVQHASDYILKAMNRRHNLEQLRDIINRLRKTIDNLVLRTTVMLGFPGETEDDFKILYNFVEETKFDWLGAFTFSAEENTPAAELKPQIADDIKAQRRDEILKLQAEITRQKNIARVNTVEDILISSQAATSLYIGRGRYQAPEVDGITLVKSETKLPKGELARVLLKGVRDYDMIGEVVDESAQ